MNLYVPQTSTNERTRHHARRRTRQKESIWSLLLSLPPPFGLHAVEHYRDLSAWVAAGGGRDEGGEEGASSLPSTGRGGDMDSEAKPGPTTTMQQEEEDPEGGYRVSQRVALPPDHMHPPSCPPTSPCSIVDWSTMPPPCDPCAFLMAPSTKKMTHVRAVVKHLVEEGGVSGGNQQQEQEQEQQKHSVGMASGEEGTGPRYPRTGGSATDPIASALPTSGSVHLPSSPEEGLPSDRQPKKAVPSSDQQAFRRGIHKRWQVESFALVLKRMLMSPPGSPSSSNTSYPFHHRRLHLVDFGCGTGALLLPLAFLFPHCTFTGVEMNPAACAILRQRADQSGLANVMVYCGMIESFIYKEEPFDVALALHACGNATDMALMSARRARAAFLVSPCCVGKLKFSVTGGTSFSPMAGAQWKWQPRMAWSSSRDKEAEEAGAILRTLALGGSGGGRGEGGPRGAGEEESMALRGGGGLREATTRDEASPLPPLHPHADGVTGGGANPLSPPPLPALQLRHPQSEAFRAALLASRRMKRRSGKGAGHGSDGVKNQHPHDRGTVATAAAAADAEGKEDEGEQEIREGEEEDGPEREYRRIAQVADTHYQPMITTISKDHKEGGKDSSIRDLTGLDAFTRGLTSCLRSVMAAGDDHEEETPAAGATAEPEEATAAAEDGDGATVAVAVVEEVARKAALCSLAKIHIEMDRLESAREEGEGGYAVGLYRMLQAGCMAKGDLLVGLPEGGKGGTTVREGDANEVASAGEGVERGVTRRGRIVWQEELLDLLQRP